MVRSAGNSLAFSLFLAIVILWAAICVAQVAKSTISLDNRAGEPALVKLIGPTGQAVDVPVGATRSVNVAAGEYYLLVRYGSDPAQYTYSRGNSFKVEETGTQYSAVTITLYTVADGNYPTRASSRAEFDAARLTSGAPTPRVQSRAQLWQYDSLCRFNDPPYPLTRESRAANTKVTFLLCEGVQKEHGHPPAILISVTNTTNSDAEIAIPGLSSVTLAARNGHRASPIAMLWPVGSPRRFMTEIAGTWSAVVPAFQRVDLIFLFSVAGAGDVISVADVTADVGQ